MSVKAWLSSLRSRITRLPKPILFVTVFAIIGTILLITTRAAGPFASIELGTGSNVTAPASIVSGDSTASGGSSVQFGGTAPVSALCTGFSSWDTASNWEGGTVPAAGQDATIAATKKVAVDMSLNSLQLKGLTVPSGTELCFHDRDNTLKAKYISVQGKLTIGTDTQPIQSKIVIQLTGGSPDITIDNYAITGQAATTMNAYTNAMGAIFKPLAGTNVMLAFNGGQIEIHGKERGTMWTQLASTSAIGTNTITLTKETQWQVGDEIVIASSSFDPLKFDEATITGVSPDKKTFTLAANLNFSHTVAVTSYTSGTETRSVEERPEVGLLSHNVVLRGPDDTKTTKFGGHTMVAPGGIMRISNTRLTDMGQLAVLGRYPLHWHINGDASASEVRNVSMDHSPNRFITIHGTNKLRMSGMVGHDTFGHGVMFEDGNEVDNSVDNSLVMTIRRQPDASKRLLAKSDDSPSEYWITHPQNSFTNSSAAGGNGIGWWYDFMCSSDNPAIAGRLCGPGGPDRLPMGTFANNISHSHMRPDDAPSAIVGTHTGSDGDGFSNEHYLGDYTKRGQILNLTVWKNTGFGSWSDGAADVVNFKGANNHIALTSQGNYNKGGIIVGYTGNTGTEVSGVSMLTRFYHGPVDYDDIWLANYERKPDGSSNKLLVAIGDESADPSDVDTRYRNIKFFGCGGRLLRLSDGCGYRVELRYESVDYNQPDGDRGHHFYDLDGSVLGDGVPAIWTNHKPLIASPLDKNYYPNALGIYGLAKFGAHSPMDRDFIRFRFEQFSVNNRLRLTRDRDGVTASGSSSAVTIGNRYFVKPDSGLPVPSDFQFRSRGNHPGYAQLYFDWPHGAPTAVTSRGVSRAKATDSNTLSHATPWYYDATAKRVYLHIEVTGTLTPFGKAGDYSTIGGDGGTVHDLAGGNLWQIRL